METGIETGASRPGSAVVRLSSPGTVDGAVGGAQWVACSVLSVSAGGASGGAAAGGAGGCEEAAEYSRSAGVERGAAVGTGPVTGDAAAVNPVDVWGDEEGGGDGAGVARDGNAAGAEELIHLGSGAEAQPPAKAAITAAASPIDRRVRASMPFGFKESCSQ